MDSEFNPYDAKHRMALYEARKKGEVSNEEAAAMIQNAQRDYWNAKASKNGEAQKSDDNNMRDYGQRVGSSLRFMTEIGLSELERQRLKERIGEIKKIRGGNDTPKPHMTLWSQSPGAPKQQAPKQQPDNGLTNPPKAKVNGEWKTYLKK